MASLMATLGLNTQSFHERLSRIRQESSKAGKEIQNNLNPKGGGGEAGGGSVKAGAMRESLVLVRELARGDFKRAASSATLLLQNLGMMGVLMNPITAAVIGLGAGFFAAWKFTGALVERLSGLKIPEIHPEYIAKHLQKINQAAEAQKEINREIKKSEELYDSAAKTAERFTGVLKEAFDHQRKMNNYAMEKELALAKTEEQRGAIRKKYSDQELAINARERAEEVRNKMQEQKDLDNEAARKKRQGDSINVSSAEHDQQLLKQKKEMADAAQEYIDKQNNKSLTDKGSDALIKGFNGIALSGVTGEDLAAAEARNKEMAQNRIQAYKNTVDQNATNDELRKQKQELYKGAGESASKAAELGKELPDIIKNNAIKNNDEASEAAAKLDAENAKGLKHSVARPDINSLQKIGAYAASVDPKLEVQRRSERHLQNIDQGIKAMLHRGGTRF